MLNSPLENAHDSQGISDTAIETFGLGAYIGAKVIVSGKVYGTACFADTEPPKKPFVDAEQFFVELIARLGGQAIERRSYEQELAQHEERLNEQQKIY